MGDGAPYEMMSARATRETSLDEVRRTNARTLAFDLAGLVGVVCHQLDQRETRAQGSTR